jgi:hypothetical protein
MKAVLKSILKYFAVNFLIAYGTLLLSNTMFSWDNAQVWMLSTAAVLAVVTTLCVSIQWTKVGALQRDR